MERRGCQREDCEIVHSGPAVHNIVDISVEHCRSVQELGLLFSISQTMETSLDHTTLVKPVLKRLQDVLGLERGTLTIVNRDTGSFLISEAVGLPKGFAAGAYLDLLRPKLQRCVEKREPVIEPGLQDWAIAEHHRTDWVDQLKINEHTCLIVVPLKFADEVVGTLSIERQSRPKEGWEPDLRLLTMIASVLGQAAVLRREAAEQMESLRQENDRLQEEIAANFRPKDMIGSAGSMKTVYYHVEQVAHSNTTVLIRGESGTGKELVAKALHEKSDRAKKTFVKFNCAALPDSIIESELFGHEKGAFTGAISMRQGRFESANGGTIFLDEIGDVSPTTQVKLLRVLQEKEFERVGSQETLRCDVRVIAATSRDLEQMISEGTFREDLYYRLNVFPIYVPPLRERKCDILLLADHFIEKYARQAGARPMRVSSAAIDLLHSYHWPGNVRELENCMERAVLLAKGQSIKAHHLPPTLQKKTKAEEREELTLADAMEALERELIVDALKSTHSNMAEAARHLAISERKMGLRVKKYEIDLDRFK